MKPDPFDEFWRLYPRKVGKGAARKAFAAALKKAPPDVIIAAVGRFALSVRGEDRRFMPYPGTWLNQERWDDDYAGEVVSAPIDLTERFDDAPEGITFDVWLRDHASPDEVEKARRFGVGRTLRATS